MPDPFKLKFNFDVSTIRLLGRELITCLLYTSFMFIHPDADQARFITIREAANLMTFPNDYEFLGNKAYCYKMIGNAVPVNFAKAIADSLYRIIK